MNRFGMACLAAAAMAAPAAFPEATAFETESRRYAPYLAKTETVVWRNRRLADIVAFDCTLKGGWIGTATAGTGVICERSADSMTVQFQCVNGGCKAVRAYFR